MTVIYLAQKKMFRALKLTNQSCSKLNANKKSYNFQTLQNPCSQIGIHYISISINKTNNQLFWNINFMRK